MDREWLLGQLRGNRAQVMAVIGEATEAELYAEPAPGRWSAAGIMRHLMDFEEDLLRGLDDRDAGRNPFWHGISDWNARNMERASEWSAKPVGDVRAALEAHRAKLEQRLMGLTDEQVAGAHGRDLSAAAVHDFEHLPSLKERLAAARRNRREAVLRYAEIGRNEVLALVYRLPEAAFEERVEGKWSIKEILLHLAARDRRWAQMIRTVSAGTAMPSEMDPAELEASNRADVASMAHYGPSRTLYEIGEARGEWTGAMLAVPDHVAESEDFSGWATRRMNHDRHHLKQLTERLMNWRKRTQA